MIENIRLSFQGIWSHKMRSFLTMLGIIIGIAAIISIVSTIKGTNEQIKNNLIGAGNNLVKVELYQEDWTYEITYNGIPDGVPVVDSDMVDKISGFDNVESASAYTKRNDSGGVYYKNSAASGSKIIGIDKNYLNTCGYVIEKGRLFNDDDYSNFKNVALIDKQTAENLFNGDDPVGKTIDISSVPFVIVGVVKESREFEPVINSIDDYYTYYQNSSGSIFLTSSAWPNVYNFDEPQNIVVRAKSTETMASAGKAVADYLNTNVTNSNNIKYKSQDLLKEAQNLQDLSNSTNQQLIWIASISLLVGGIGVMNIMLVSVTERTREIGLKKAIGAKKKKILWQFLTEAAVLTSLGGILGVGGGIGMSQIISKMSGAPVAISVPSIVIAVIFSMAIGIVFGLLPSVKASNLNPIDALRHE